MVLGSALLFLSGLFVGAFFGALAVVLGVMAKRSDEDKPETRDMPDTLIGTTREVRHLRW
jgi:hypothetical protein